MERTIKRYYEEFYAHVFYYLDGWTTSLTRPAETQPRVNRPVIGLCLLKNRINNQYLPPAQKKRAPCPDGLTGDFYQTLEGWNDSNSLHFPPKKNRNRPTITPDPSPTRRQPEVAENRPRVGWGEGALICHAVNNHSPPAASVIVSI